MSDAASIRSTDDAVTIEGERLLLVPLAEDDAEEMAQVLGNERLHEFIGGHPATEAELRVRYSKLAAGSTTPDEVWLNWVVRRRADDRAIGTVQATVTTTGGRCTGLIAWVIGVPWQGQGYASEAARMLVSWLCEHGADDIGTHINPGNHASMAVATRAGLYATDEDVDSELLWRARKQGNP